MKFLDRAVSGERAAIFDRLVVVVECRIEPLRQFAPSEADAEGLGGLDGADAGLAESVDGAEPVRAAARTRPGEPNVSSRVLARDCAAAAEWDADSRSWSSSASSTA